MAQTRLVVYAELKLKKGIPFSRNHIRRLEKAEQFPMHVTLNDGGSIAWIEQEIDDYVARLAAKRTPAAAASSDEASGPSTKSNSKVPARGTTRNASKRARAGPRNLRSDQDNRTDQFA